jgi:hypothetical protein
MNAHHKIGPSLRHLPGQGLHKAAEELWISEVWVPLIVAFIGVVIFILECLHISGLFRPSILFGALAMLLATTIAARKIIKGLPKYRMRKRGEEGERIVAQYIERDLIPQGYSVFHDIQLEKDGKTFNIDHLLVGPNGVFAVETKNYSKPSRGEARVTYDGHQLLWNGQPRRDEDKQARSIAAAAHEYIADLTGISVIVRPVLCAIGWFAASTALYQHPVLLVMEKTLGSVILKVSPPSGWNDSNQRVVARIISRAQTSRGN